MATTELIPTTWRDWTTFALRWLFLIGMSLAVFVWRSEIQPIQATPPAYDDLAIAFGIGAALTIVYGISVFIQSFRIASPYILIIIDPILTVLFLNLVQAQPSFVLSIAGFLAVTGLLNLGPMLGAIQGTTVVAVALGMVLVATDTTDFATLIEPYGIPLIALLLLVIGAEIWVYARLQFGDGQAGKISQVIRENAKQVDDMRERTRMIADLTSSLIGTLKFDKILETALDIGQISFRKENNKQRFISMVLLFRSWDDALYIASHRGLHSGTDTSRVLWGKEGIIARCLNDAEPIVGENAWQDPELCILGGMNNLRSVLVIPLRAHYDNYGVLVYACEERDAFNEDHIDTLRAIGVQATIALQNAVLYNSLMEEKERIIQMEEDARKSLVRDLHDIPTQTVSAIAMRIPIILRMLERTPDEVPEELRNVEQMARRATEEIRHVLFKLRPLALESQGLTAALEQLAEKMEKTYKQNMQVKVGPDVEKYLDETQQGALFYLIEEAANNARKYAEASLISVQVIRKNNIIAVRINDNGKGFDAEGIEAKSAGKGSFGMTNMRERAELLDGTLTIKSDPGRGTTITVVIPVDDSKIHPTSESANGRAQIPMTKLAAVARTKL